MGDASSLRSSVLWLLLLLSLAIDVPLPAMGGGPCTDVRLRMKGESSAISNDDTPGYAQVRLRIEGEADTIFEGNILTRGKTVSPTSGVKRNCGGNFAAATTALDDAAMNSFALSPKFTWNGTYIDDKSDYNITSIGSSSAASGKQWNIYVRYTPIFPVLGCHKVVQSGDDILFAFHEPNVSVTLLMLSGPQKIPVGNGFTVTAINALTGAPVAGVEISNGNCVSTNASGIATCTAPESTSILTLKGSARDPRVIPSNSIYVSIVTAQALA